MPNNMRGLLQSPMFMTGASLLANNTGHYGAFGPALGNGILGANQAMQQQKRIGLLNKLTEGQIAQMPGDTAYKKAMAYRAMNPTKSTSEAERLINQIQNNPNDPRVPQWKARLAKINAPSSSLVNFNYGTPSNPTTTRLNVTEDLVKSNPNINLGKLTDTAGEEAVSIIDAEITAIQKQFAGRKQPVPSAPEVLNMMLMKSMLLIG